MLLKPDELAARLRLYTELQAAYAEFNEVANAIPEVAPKAFEVSCDTMPPKMVRRIEFVIKRAWLPLRAAVLKDAQKKVDDAEAAVKAFEAGEEVKTDGV